MKDNLYKADTHDTWCDDVDWPSIDGMRHSIRPRSSTAQGFVPRSGADVLTGSMMHPVSQGTKQRGSNIETGKETGVAVNDRKAASAYGNTITVTPYTPEPTTSGTASLAASTAPIEHYAAEAPGGMEHDDVSTAFGEKHALKTVTPAGVARSGLPHIAARREMPQWEDLPLVKGGKNRPHAVPVVDAKRDSLSGQAFDLLRTRLRQTTRENGWVNIAVTAPARGCGSTFTALNLALSLSRIPGSRSVLMDFNLRNPGIARALDIEAAADMRDYISGDVAMCDHLRRVSDTLALGLNGNRDEDAAETLQHPELARTLDRMRAALRPDLVIYDLPPMQDHDDVSALLPQLDGVLLVSDGTKTTARQLAECEKMLDGQVPLLGVVLNRARADSLRRSR